VKTIIRAICKLREAIEEATDIWTAVGRTDFPANRNLAHLELNPKSMIVVNDVEIFSDLCDSFGNIVDVIMPVSKQ
jgi:hypothetical protein